MLIFHFWKIQTVIFYIAKTVCLKKILSQSDSFINCFLLLFPEQIALTRRRHRAQWLRVLRPNIQAARRNQTHQRKGTAPGRGKGPR